MVGTEAGPEWTVDGQFLMPLNELDSVMAGCSCEVSVGTDGHLTLPLTLS